MVLGEMDVARAKPELWLGGSHQRVQQLGRVPPAAATANFRGATRDLPRLGLHGALGMGEDVRIGQKEEMFVKEEVFVFVGLKPFRPIRAVAGLWDVG